jgi:hypothetical protein
VLREESRPAGVRHTTERIRVFPAQSRAKGRVELDPSARVRARSQLWGFKGRLAHLRSIIGLSGRCCKAEFFTKGRRHSYEHNAFPYKIKWRLSIGLGNLVPARSISWFEIPSEKPRRTQSEILKSSPFRKNSENNQRLQQLTAQIACAIQILSYRFPFIDANELE